MECNKAEGYAAIVGGLCDFVFAYLALTPKQRSELKLGVTAAEAGERLALIAGAGVSWRDLNFAAL